MRIPSNIITDNQYTAGKEFMYISTYKEYIGYYYIINNKYFTGKTYSNNSNSKELVKIKKENTNLLLTQASTYIYGLISKTKMNNISPSSIISTGNINGGIRYFSKQVNINPILIREINEDTFKQFQNNPIYQVISIEFPKGGYFGGQKSLDEAEKQMPGIKTFISSELPPD
jgi:hypothetical protein